MERQKCLPTEVKNRRHQERKRMKLDRTADNSAANSEPGSPKSEVQTTSTTEKPSSASPTAEKHIEPMDE